MKRFIRLFAVAASGLVALACYDDSALNTRIDGLEERVEALEQMNTDLQSIKTLIEALQNDVYIKTVTPTADGYDILLSNGETLSLKNGAKGDAGAQGPAGDTGPQGKQGDKGDAPQIGVVLENGVYYWTVNGQIVTDAAGNKIPVHSATPKLKLEEGKWYVSYDNGATWEHLAASGVSESGFFSDVTVGASSVTFTLMNGDVFELPLGNGFTLSVAENVACLPNTTTGVPYVVTGADNPLVYCLADGDYSSSIKKETATTGTVLITAKAENAEGQVLVIATNNIKTLVKAITLSRGQLIVKDAYTISADGGQLEIEVETNLDYVAKSTVNWITIVGTKADLRKETVTANVAENPEGSPERSGDIQICSPDGSPLQAITVIQKGDGSLTIAGYLYPSYEAQTIDPSTKLNDYAGKTPTTTASWITVESDGKLTLTQNDGIVRIGYVQYGSKTLCVIQNPGLAFLDLSFENASGDLATNNRTVQNVGTAKALDSGPTTYFIAFEGNAQTYSKPITIVEDDVLGHKVASYHNTICPSSYGSVLWRNANGNTVKSMYDGFTVELLLRYNSDMWTTGGGGKNSEGNAFCYKSTTTNTGEKALSVGVIGNNDGVPVFTCILKGTRTTSSFVVKDGVYYHFVVSYDYANKKVTLYANGEQIAQANETRDMANVLEVGSATPWWGSAQTNLCDPWILGGYLNGEWQTPNSNWNGEIAVCRVYGSTLSGAEIAQSYKILSTPLPEE